MTNKAVIYVVEDDNLYRKRIIQYLSAYHSHSFHYEISHLDNHLLFMEEIPALKISDNDVFFLDIDLKTQYTGIDLANEIRKFNTKCTIIFLTNFEDKAIPVINSKIFPLGYLVKDPIDSSELKTMIGKVLLQIESHIKESWRKNQDIVTFMNGYESVYINCREILYIESLKGVKGRVVIKTLSEELVIEGRIGKFKKDLKQPYLFTALQSYIINFENISSIHRKNGTIIFVNNQEIFVGTRIIDKVKKGLQDYNHA